MVIFSTAGLGILGSLLGVLAGIATIVFGFGSYTAAGTENTSDVIGILTVALGLLGFVAVLIADRHHTAARALFVFTGLAGFLVAAVLWIPAGLFLVLAGLTGFLTRPE